MHSLHERQSLADLVLSNTPSPLCPATKTNLKLVSGRYGHTRPQGLSTPSLQYGIQLEFTSKQRAVEGGASRAASWAVHPSVCEQPQAEQSRAGASSTVPPCPGALSCGWDSKDNPIPSGFHKQSTKAGTQEGGDKMMGKPVGTSSLLQQRDKWQGQTFPHAHSTKACRKARGHPHCQHLPLQLFQTSLLLLQKIQLP